MKKTSLLSAILTLFLAFTACDESEDAAPSYDLTGVWVNVGDEYYTFTFNEDKSGNYNYSYLTDDLSISTTGRFDGKAGFNLYLTEHLGDGTYALRLFGESDFPIYNATFKIIDGYLQISYDWLDTEGHDVKGVVEAYRFVSGK